MASTASTKENPVSNAQAPELSVSQRQALVGMALQGAAAQATKGETKAPIEGVKNAKSDFMSWLYQSHGPLYDDNITKLETYTALKREQLSIVIAFFVGLYLVLGSGAQIMCSFIGFAYPCYVSVKAIRTDGKDDDTQWLIYWTVFAFFSIVDFFAGWIMSWFPAYWLAKTIFLVYLYLPQTMGAQTLYVAYVDPCVTAIDKYLEDKKQA